MENSEDEDFLQKRIEESNRSFWMLGLTVTPIFLLLPVIIWLFSFNWIKALSLSGWIGFGFMVFSFILLSVRSESRGLVSRSYLPQGADGDVTQRKMIFRAMFKSKTNIGVWLLFWGFIYALVFAFGVPFFPN